MASRSSIERLPREILENLQELLRNPRVTVAEVTDRVNDLLAESGEAERVSKSAVNRYDLKMREVGAKVQQSREIANMWIGKFGAESQGKVGNLLNEMLRTVAFDLALKVGEMDLDGDESMEAVASMVGKLSLAVQRLEQGATLNAKREREIREQIRAETVSQVEKVARQAGLTDEGAQLIRDKILGIK